MRLSLPAIGDQVIILTTLFPALNALTKDTDNQVITLMNIRLKLNTLSFKLGESNFRLAGPLLPDTFSYNRP